MGSGSRSAGAAVEADGEQPLKRAGVRTGRGKQHATCRRASSRAPGRVGVVGEPARHAARGRHDEDVDVAVVAAGERHLVPSGENTGSVSTPGPLVSRTASPPCRGTRPQVAGVDEDDRGGADRGLR